MAALDVEISPEAQRDLVLIVGVSRRTWGDEQAERYRRQLQEACERIGGYPGIGSVQPRLPTIRAYPNGAHRIY